MTNLTKSRRGQGRWGGDEAEHLSGIVELVRKLGIKRKLFGATQNGQLCTDCRCLEHDRWGRMKK